MTKLCIMSGASVLTLLLLSSAANAHPVPKNTHDRTVVVHVERDPGAEKVTVRVNYRLEVDELTVVTKDLEPYDIDAFQYRGKALQLYTELARRLGPDLAARFNAKANGQRLEFTSAAPAMARLHDDNQTPLGHLRCDFVFGATFTPLAGDNELKFEDMTYWNEDGKIDLSIVPGAGVRVVSATVPTDALKNRSPLEREPGDEARLRNLRVVFAWGDQPATTATPREEKPPPAAPRAAHDEYSLLRLFLDTEYGFWLTLLMAGVFGAAHALTPGHGKTLVAAYLVGERGTMLHAVVLGVVTTLTHTGVVLLLAVILFCLPGDARAWFAELILSGLGLSMGLVVVCMGFWLLLQRLSGRADHIHVGGGHHHHHHGGHVHAVPTQDAGGVRWWGLIVLGMAGGMVPCWDAIVLLMYSVIRGELLVALPLVLAFSAGLAGVLVLIGVLVVQVPKFARSRWGNGKIVRALPIASALVISLMGVWLCFQSVHGQ